MIGNWFAFAVLVYGLGVGARWWPGPIAVLRHRMASRAAAEPFGQRGEGTPNATEGDDSGGDIDVDNAADSDIATPKAQDTALDRGQPNPSPDLWTRFRRAADQLRTPTSDVAGRPSAVPHPRGAAGGAHNVTARPGVGGQAKEPKVVVHHVAPGSWTGRVSGVGDDGEPVVIRYLPRASLATSPETLSRPARPEPATPGEDPGEELEAQGIDEITVRREWLRTMLGSGRFTSEEVRDLYTAKWGKTTKTYGRDVAALAAQDPGQLGGRG